MLIECLENAHKMDDNVDEAQYAAIYHIDGA